MSEVVAFPTNRARAACYACFDFAAGAVNECPECGRGIGSRLPVGQRPARPAMFSTSMKVPAQ